MKQLFPKTTQPKLEPDDQFRLQDHLESANKLSDLFLLDTISTDDLKRMLLLEVKNRHPRHAICTRLIGRINKRERRRILSAIFPANENNKTH